MSTNSPPCITPVKRRSTGESLRKRKDFTPHVTGMARVVAPALPVLPAPQVALVNPDPLALPVNPAAVDLPALPALLGLPDRNPTEL